MVDQVGSAEDLVLESFSSFLLTVLILLYLAAVRLGTGDPQASKRIGTINAHLGMPVPAAGALTARHGASMKEVTRNADN